MVRYKVQTNRREMVLLLGLAIIIVHAATVRAVKIICNVQGIQSRKYKKQRGYISRRKDEKIGTKSSGAVSL